MRRSFCCGENDLRRLIVRNASDSVRLLLLDLDGTLTREPSPWKHIHERLGLWGQAVRHLEDFTAGKIDYHEFCRLDVDEWRETPCMRIRGFLDEIEFRPAALRLLPQWAAVSGLHIVLLSSGFDCVARRLLDACGIFNGRISVIAQTLECDASGRARVEPRVVLKDARSDKRAHLEKYLAAHGLDISQTAAFDDHTDDERLFSGMCRVWRISDDETLENAALELEPLLPQERQA